MPDARFPFSNFETVPGGLEIEGIRYSTAEHAYQALKTLDRDERQEIAAMATPAQAKRRGRMVTLRPDWNDLTAASLMTVILAIKFLREPFRSRLLAFEGPIVEWNTWHDTVWGRCTCPRHGGQGRNRLGVILEGLRQGLRQPREEATRAAT